MAHELDRVMKMLAARYPSVFMQLLFGDRHDVVFKRVEDTTINIPQKQSDKVFRISENGREGIINFEFMAQPDSRPMSDFHIKSGMLTAAFQCEVVTLIFYLEKGRYRTIPDTYQPDIGGLQNRNQFAVICLWDYKRQIESGELKELIPLLVLCEDHPDLAVLRKEKEFLNRISDTKERADMIALSMMIAFRKFAKNIVSELFKEEQHIMKESDFIQEFIAEGRAEGWEKGLAEGWEKGLEKGREDGEIIVLKRQIEKKFGMIPESLIEQIHHLEYSQRENLILSLLDMNELSELEEWFLRHPEKKPA